MNNHSYDHHVTHQISEIKSLTKFILENWVDINFNILLKIEMNSFFFEEKKLSFF